MRIIAVLGFVVACGKGDKPSDDKKSPPATAMPAGALAKLTVSVDGAPLAVDRAYIKRVSTDVFTVTVGAGKGSCESLLAGTEDKTGKAFSFTIAKRVAPAGHENYVVTDLWSRDFETKPAMPVKAKLDGNPNDAGATVTIMLPAIADKALTVSGMLTAVGCGEGPPPTGMGVPKVTPQNRSSITVAGKTLPVRGTTVSARKGSAAMDLPNITISTAPKDCSSVTLPAPIILERKDGKWSLHGTWFDQPIEGADAETTELTFSANDVGKGPDGPTLTLQLSGAGKIGEYSVRLGGVAEAIECL